MVSTPSFEYRSFYGTITWETLGGLLHREDDLPAMILTNGTKKWFRFGKLHRLDGPAYMGSLGYNWWFINDIQFKAACAFQTQTGHSDEYMAELLMKYGDIE